MATICWSGREFRADCQRVDARASGVSDEDVVLLGEMMAEGEFGSLETLWLVNLLVVFLCSFCAPSLIEWSCLQFDNQISDAGACALGQGLSKNCSLKWLNLVRASFVARVLSLCFSLHWFGRSRGFFVNLCGEMTHVLKWKNQVGDSGAVGFGQSLKLNNSLQFLELVRDFWLFLHALFV
jgi:hypothetical protein